MSYTQLLDPFTIQFEKDGWEFNATITYVKLISSCVNYFHVKLNSPEGTEPFYLNEKPTPNSSSNEMVWADENNKSTMLYQIIGGEIEKSLRQNEGVFLIDAPVHDNQDDSVTIEEKDQ